MVAPVFPLFEIFRFFANAGAALRLARGKSRARHELTGDEEPREADGAANGDEDWIHLRARARVWSVDRFIHSFPGHHATDASRRNDGTTDRGKEGTNETFPGPFPVRISHDERTIGARSVVRSRRTLLLDPFTREEDATEEDATDDDAPLGEANAERTTCRIETRFCSLADRRRVSRDARPVVPRAGTTDAFVRVRDVGARGYT